MLPKLVYTHKCITEYGTSRIAVLPHILKKEKGEHTFLVGVEELLM